MTKQRWASVIGFSGILLFVAMVLSFNGLLAGENPRKDGDNQLCNEKTDNPLAFEKLETPRVCAEDNPAEGMEKDPKKFARRRCDKFCEGYACSHSMCIAKEVKDPTKISVTCTKTEETCDNDERKHLWNCETKVTEGSYGCSCKCSPGD